MNNFLKHLLTGKDNETYDIGRFTWLIGTVAVIGLAIYEVSTAHLSLREFAEAFGIVSGASGAAVAVKGKTEPDA